jgi:hypothetical protein
MNIKDKYKQETIVKYIEFLHYTCKYQILRSIQELNDNISYNPDKKELIDKWKKLIKRDINHIYILDELTQYLKKGHNLEWFNESFLHELGNEYYLEKWKKVFKKK